jgi:hypothetical protein
MTQEQRDTMERCLSCNQPGVVIHIFDEPRMRGFPFCAGCLADLDAGNYAGLADRMLVNHDDMAYTARNQRIWEGAYRDIAKEQYRVPVAQEGAPEPSTLTDTPAQIARAAIASYREYVERYGRSPDEATEAAVREVTEGLAVDVDAIRAELAAQPAPEEMRGWPL